MAAQDDTRYNGWSNYETWTVTLFISNESNECIVDATRVALQDTWGDALKTFVEDYFTVDLETNEVAGGNMFVQQMLGAAMSEVNWKELRDHYVADAADWMELDTEDEDEDEDEDNE